MFAFGLTCSVTRIWRSDCPAQVVDGLVDSILIQRWTLHFSCQS